MKHVGYVLLVCLVARDVMDGKRLAFCTDATLSECRVAIEDMKTSPSASDYAFEGCEENAMPDVNSIEDTTGELIKSAG